MIKTFKKALAIMMTIVFVLSLVPTFALAETTQGVQIGLSSPVWVRTDKETAVQDYSTHLRAGTITNAYRAVFQLDFGGYEYLLRDESSELSLTLASGGRIGSGSVYLYDFNMYVMDDANDVYGTYYEVYSDASNGMTYNELNTYVDLLTSVDGLTPFASRTESTAISSSYTSDANKQVVIDALDASTDDSVITIQFINGGANNSNKCCIKHGSNVTYLTINSAGENATPANYVADVAERLSWADLSSEPMNSVSSQLSLPTKYLGTNIVWESSNETAVNPETGVVTINPDAYTYVTLTAKLTYEAYTGETSTATQTFDIRLPKDVYDYSSGSGTYYDASDDAFFSRGGSSSSSTHVPAVTRVGGIAGKTDADLCYEVRDASGNYRYDFTELSGDDPLKRDVLEFSMCIPSDCYGFSTFIKAYKDIEDSSQGGTSSTSFSYYNDGIYLGNSRIISWNGDRWHHVAIIAPGIVTSDASGITYDTTVKIYVDGVLEYNRDLNDNAINYPRPFGFSYCQVNGLCSMDDYDTTTKTFSTIAGYLDNLRWTNDVYNPAYNTKSSVASTYDIDSKADMLTVVTEGTTVKDIVDSLTIDEEATARVYNADFELVDDDSAVVADDYTIVVADTNGTTSERTFAYYDIRVVEDGEFAFDLPYITKADVAVNGTVKLFNYSGEKKTYKVYLAVYSEDDDLIELKPATLAVENGNKGDITTHNADFEDGNYAKLFIWEDDDITPALSSVYFE